MKKISALAALMLCLFVIHADAQTLTSKWNSEATLSVPEAVLLDAKNNVIYVANIDGKPDSVDGAGFISQLTPDGKIKNLKWVTGLDAPKGMGLVKNTLYVSDIHRVVAIDITAGKISQRIDIAGSAFLNDITVDDKGNVYVSDTGTGKIHKIVNGKAEVFFESQDIKSPNGLLALKEGLYIADFGTGAFHKLGWDKKLTKIGTIVAGSDGIVQLEKDKFLVSSWYGEAHTITASGAVEKVLDTKDQKLNAADIDFDSKTRTLYVPTFFANTVAAYTLGKK
ncbi:SMP-30/gluconolactonase/LRE family protein [Pseudochryseolinea flava]|uniref:ATP/GTP-binding protein n=1 Tax=Pseudochryseolinea flava TaxID=2059302 RepID=A0A364Y1L5_9BACT|nr:ATP/GTP-binding protein [Pseudochryseolinea flava]RAV99839.1 ATP/GTP-binding protein [Pseudochryseolinea flava]